MKNNKMKQNKMRYILDQGLPSLGTRVWSSWPYMTETVGESENFDYVEFVAEYAPFNQYDLENIARAAELSNMGTMIKADLQNRQYVAQKAVASGFQSILFADHVTPDEIRESVLSVKPDLPEYRGRFGYPNRRYIGFQPYLPQLDHAKRISEIVTVFMIEKAEAMEHIEEICSIPGVDMVQFGPSDYAMSLGWNTTDHLEECKAAERKMIEVALKHGVQPRCELYGSPEDAQYYIDLGVKHFCYGDEFNNYYKFLTNEGSKMKQIVDGLK